MVSGAGEPGAGKPAVDGTAVGVPLRVAVDHRHGGRWTSISGGGREWLWRGTADGRDRVSPGDAFVDAGGLEECVPTVRGTPDHGDAWSRPWRPTGPASATACGGLRQRIAVVDCPDFSLERRIAEEAGAVVARYRLRADPGHRFVWAAHALLDLSPAARLVAPAGTPTRLYPEAAALLPAGTWPPGARWHTADWPEPAGLALHRLGPDDGTALGAVLVGCADVRVVDGPDVLRLRLESPGQPRSTALWRNLGGWPETAPYRSIGVEPMLGAVFDLAEAEGTGVGDDGAATVPAGGEVEWQLAITAERAR
ncbi:hypothetical protein ACN27G_11435 [Plantactinospora sp. WMMB334]|uniref:hypothetical protein n=1 Tax=Plantactinospora sp. WMMB334 TaxID=3404119 RepID=UPI003B938401